MKVFGFYSADDQLTAPFPAARRGGIKVRLLGGDVYDPVGPWKMRPEYSIVTYNQPVKRNWFNAIPSSARKTFVHVACLPFVSWGIGRWGGYIGFKCYGFDSPKYLDFPLVQPEDVKPGSLALCFSMRLTLNRPRNQS